MWASPGCRNADNEYTDAQVGDTGGLFKSLDPVPCGAVPAYLIECSSSSLPDPVLQIQSTSSSAAVPAYLIQCFRSNLPHPLLQFQSTSSSAPIPVYLTSPEDFNFCCSFFLFLYIFFLSNFTFFELLLYNNIHHYFILF